MREGGCLLEGPEGYMDAYAAGNILSSSRSCFCGRRNHRGLLVDWARFSLALASVSPN